MTCLESMSDESMNGDEDHASEGSDDEGDSSEGSSVDEEGETMDGVSEMAFVLLRCLFCSFLAANEDAIFRETFRKSKT